MSKTIKLDIKKAIDFHNENNPDNKITRKILSKELGEILDVDPNTMYQNLANYYRGKTPSIMKVIDFIMQRTGVEYTELVKKEENE